MGALTRQDHVHPLRQNEAWHRQAQTYLARLAKDEDGVYRTYGQWGNMVYLRTQYAW